MQGRVFTLRELKKAIISSCKGYLNDFYRTCWNMNLEDIIEAVELVSELQNDVESRYSDTEDFYDALGVK